MSKAIRCRTPSQLLVQLATIKDAKSQAVHLKVFAEVSKETRRLTCTASSITCACHALTLQQRQHT